MLSCRYTRTATLSSDVSAEISEYLPRFLVVIPFQNFDEVVEVAEGRSTLAWGKEHREHFIHKLLGFGVVVGAFDCSVFVVVGTAFFVAENGVGF